MYLNRLAGRLNYVEILRSAMVNATDAENLMHATVSMRDVQTPTCSMRMWMESWVSWPLWLAQRALCSRPLVEACMLQYTRSPPTPVTLMQGPSTSPALRNGPERTPAAGA